MTSLSAEMRYVYCLDHPWLKNGNCPSVAISGFVPDRKHHGEIGFNHSVTSRNLRRSMIAGTFAYDGIGFRSVTNDGSVYFTPQRDSFEFMGKLISQTNGYWLNKSSSRFSLSDEFRENFLSLVSDAVYINKKPALVDKLGQLHVAYNLEMQFWPYATPFESVCYFFGEDTKNLVKSLCHFFQSRNQTVSKVSWRDFPVY